MGVQTALAAKETYDGLTPKQKQIVTGITVATPIVVVGGLIGGIWFLGKRFQNSPLAKSFDLFLKATDGAEAALEKQVQNLVWAYQQASNAGEEGQKIIDELGLGRDNTPEQRVRNLQHLDDRVVQEARKRIKGLF